jgi:hypothetical protein
LARYTHCSNARVGARTVSEAYRGTGIVDEHLLAGAAHLSHQAVQLPGEAEVIFTELGVTVGLLVIPLQKELRQK